MSTDTSCRNWEEGVESQMDGFGNFHDNAPHKLSNLNIIYFHHLDRMRYNKTYLGREHYPS